MRQQELLRKIPGSKNYYKIKIKIQSGEREKEMKDLSKREYKCKNCKLEIYRDINASVNIMFEGIKELIKKDMLLEK